MKKYCESAQLARYAFGVLIFKCVKRHGHFGKHCDAYGGQWKKMKGEK